MREFDHAGLLLAEYQGKLFEKSTDLNCSSPIFIRRFFLNLRHTSTYNSILPFGPQKNGKKQQMTSSS